MNAAIPPAVLARIAAADIHERLNRRAVLQLGMRDRLRCFIRQSGPLSAKEAQDWVTCIAELVGDDIREIKKDLTEVSITLEGLDSYEAPDPRDD